MKQLLEDIKTGRFKQAYLLYGQEAYLRRQYRDKLKEALLPPDDTMNLAVFEGKNIDQGGVIDLAETLPFFADRRVLLVEGSGLFKKGGDQLAAYLKEPAPSAFFIFAEADVDKRSRLFKAVKELGSCVEFAPQDESTLKRWILGAVKRENKKISEAALNLFLDKTGTDMENISQEMEKLFCYTALRDVILPEDVEMICTKQVTGQIFDMVEAIAGRRQQAALKLYYDLLSLKEPPMRILFLISRQFNLLLQVKELKEKGTDSGRIAEKTGLHSFVVKKYVAQAAHFTKEKLREALEECVGMDEAVKSGRISDTMGVELLIVKYSRKAG